MHKLKKFWNNLFNHARMKKFIFEDAEDFASFGIEYYLKNGCYSKKVIFCEYMRRKNGRYGAKKLLNCAIEYDDNKRALFEKPFDTSICDKIENDVDRAILLLRVKYGLKYVEIAHLFNKSSTWPIHRMKEIRKILEFHYSF